MDKAPCDGDGGRGGASLPSDGDSNKSPAAMPVVVTPPGGGSDANNNDALARQLSLAAARAVVTSSDVITTGECGRSLGQDSERQVGCARTKDPNNNQSTTSTTITQLATPVLHPTCDVTMRMSCTVSVVFTFVSYLLLCYLCAAWFLRFPCL